VEGIGGASLGCGRSARAPRREIIARNGFRPGGAGDLTRGMGFAQRPLVNFRSPKENVVAKALRSPWTISAALFITLMAVALLIA
jgi:hypothetical protein